MDYRQEIYNKRIKEEEEQSKLNRAKRNLKKENEILKNSQHLEMLKDHSTGLILWKQKNNAKIWEGYINNKKCFKINHGIYKYSLSVYVETENKKDKNIKTSFELQPLQIIAESIAKKIQVKES